MSNIEIFSSIIQDLKERKKVAYFYRTFIDYRGEKLKCETSGILSKKFKHLLLLVLSKQLEVYAVQEVLDVNIFSKLSIEFIDKERRLLQFRVVFRELPDIIQDYIKNGL